MVALYRHFVSVESPHTYRMPEAQQQMLLMWSITLSSVTIPTDQIFLRRQMLPIKRNFLVHTNA